MAVSLTKSFAGLCIQAGNAIRSISHTQISCEGGILQLYRSFSALQIKGLENGNRESEWLSKSNLHTSSACMTTPELKEWREHRIIDRFYRLPWGGWIRTRGGRRKGLYKKVPRHRWQLQQHIFCNYHQNKLLDTLVAPKWKEPKYFADSPYEPYFQRTNSYWQPNNKKFYP
ncbi:hypothetical protein EGW08_013780 [Elysia chlorotica]|uniref:Large ribosomal subunit protein bL35m n=1 Tax=Elysia chlorotica TaxID=188477 RepID=A0A3S1B9P6_ELYCH|nr:hypothetical protein EGW08_013780 [Elysia chlorotica]